MCSSDGKIISLIQSKFKNDSESLTTDKILCDIVESEKFHVKMRCVFEVFEHHFYCE